MNNDEDLVSTAIKVYLGESDTYYEKYTKEMLVLIDKYYPLNNHNFDKYQQHAKTARAVLSQGVGAASKTAKGLIILHYARKMSDSPDLDMSLREAQEVFKLSAGRSVAKAKLTGLFNRNGDTRFSPFFTDKDYKNKVLSHDLVLSLTDKIKEYDEKKPKTTNPLQYKIDKAIASYNK